MTLTELVVAMGTMLIAAEAHGLQAEVTASFVDVLVPNIEPELLEIAINAALGEWDI